MAGYKETIIGDIPELYILEEALDRLALRGIAIQTWFAGASDAAKTEPLTNNGFTPLFYAQLSADAPSMKDQLEAEMQSVFDDMLN